MRDVFLYHIVPGTWDLSGIGVNDIHTLLPTSLTLADLGNNQPQALCVHRSLSPGNNSAILEILKQKVSPRFLGTASFANITFYFIDTVLRYPASYAWESPNTNEMQQWNALAEAVPSDETLEDYDGVTILAPYDQAWVLSSILTKAQPLSVFDNHVSYSHRSL